MDPTDIGLFHLAEQRLAWVDRRQALLAQNIANANTPAYRPRDVAPFAATLGASTLSRTAPGHLAGGRGAGGPGSARPQQLSPNGNGVSMEEQLGRVADTSAMQEMTINLQRRYAAMFRTAYGRGG